MSVSPCSRFDRCSRSNDERGLTMTLIVWDVRILPVFVLRWHECTRGDLMFAELIVCLGWSLSCGLFVYVLPVGQWDVLFVSSRADIAWLVLWGPSLCLSRVTELWGEAVIRPTIGGYCGADDIVACSAWNLSCDLFCLSIETQWSVYWSGCTERSLACSRRIPLLREVLPPLSLLTYVDQITFSAWHLSYDLFVLSIVVQWSLYFAVVHFSFISQSCIPAPYFKFCDRTTWLFTVYSL